MEILIVIIVGAVLVILMTNFRQEVKRNMRIVNKNIINVRKELEAIRKDGSIEKVTADTQKAEEEKPLLRPKVDHLELSGQRLVSSSASESKPAEKPEVSAEKETKKETQKPEVSSTPKKVQPNKNKKPVLTAAFSSAEKKPAQSNQPQVKPKRDLEKVIGENWLNKIGIAILVLGIGFFVKYAIDKNWILEGGRVAIGIGLGGILIGIAHFLRKKYHAFSSVLIGGGISVLYYTITIAYHDYQIFNQKTAFGIMVAITIFSTVISIIYDRKELAIIALIGAFTSPFMVQNGEGNYKVFFTYIAIINTGMLVLSYFKKWNILEKLALGFTALFFGTWMFTTNMYGTVHAKWAILFISIFYLQFLGMSLIYNLSKKCSFTAFEFIQLTGITALFNGGMLYVIESNNYPIGMGGFTMIMSGVYIALALFVKLREGADKKLVFLLIGKAIAFVTLTGGMLFEGDYMTLFWAVEAIVILTLAQYSNMGVLKNASVIITIITAIGLCRDWLLTYALNSTTMQPIFNGTFITTLIVVGTFIITFMLMRKESDEKQFFIGKTQYHLLIGALIFGLGYFGLLFELIHQLRRLEYAAGALLIIWIFHLLIVIIGNLIARLRSSHLMTQIFVFISLVGTFFYLIAGQYNNFEILKDSIQDPNKLVYYALHFGLAAGVIGLLFMLRKTAYKIVEDRTNRDWFLAAISVVGLVITTLEMEQIIGQIFAKSHPLPVVLSHVRNEGYTILWGIYSFILMIRGMQKKNKIMRILALVMFSVTLLKLFIFDIQNISEAGKIIAFISLGVLLLVISFLYQKLKAIIVDGKVE